ncbi:MAG: carboxypeptidase regulatory-like domain-containing protein [Terriglobia bacterium]
MKQEAFAFKPRSPAIRLLIALFIAVLILGAGSLIAQDLGSISGSVTDASGAAVPNATVTVTDQLRSVVVRTLSTNSAGNYAVPDLPTGTYSVRAGKPGFTTAVHSDLVLNVRSQVRVDFNLSVGAVTQQVTVTAPAVHLQTQSGAVSQEITSKHIAAIDTDGRNFIQLTTLVPGAVGPSLIGSLNVPVGVTANSGVNFNGERQAHNVFSVDGQENYDRGCGGCIEIVPDQNAIAQFNVLTSSAASDVGNGSGGDIQLELKSGTSSYHGEAFEFNRNTSFQAGAFFSNAAHQPKPPLLYNDFGFNIGGPVALPGHQKKTFFFFEMDWRKLNQGVSFHTLAPQAGWASGNFGTGSPVILDKTKSVACPAGVSGTCYQPFPSNAIPTAMLDKNATILGAPGLLFPLANDGAYFVGSARQPINVNEQIARVDHQFSDKTSLMVHYVRDGIDQHYATSLWSSDSYPSVGTDFLNEPQSILAKLTRSITPTLLNEAMIGFNRQPLTLLPLGTFQRPSGVNIASLYPGTNTENRIPTISFSAPLGTAYDIASWPWTNVLNTWTLRDSATKIMGNHTFNFGVYYLHYMKQQELFGNTQGNFNFNPQNTALGTGGQYIDPANPSQVLTTTGNSFADFMLGNAWTYTELQKQTLPAYLNTQFEPWFGDTWKIKSNVTLNYGLRWDYMPHASERHNNISVFRPSLFNPANAPQIDSSGHFVPGTGVLTNVNGGTFYLNGIGIAGQNGVPDILVANHWTNFEPRFGFAWQPRANGKTVVRGGFALEFENVQGNDIYNVAPNPPFSNSPQFFNTNFTNPGGAATLSPGGLQAYDPNYLQPYSKQWDFGVQHEFTPQVVASVMYVGSEGTHQQVNTNINQPTAPVTTGNINQFRPYPGWGSIGWYANDTNANYNSLQGSLRFATWHGLTSGVAYTYSHCLDYVDNDNSGFYNNNYNLNAEYGNCGFDVRHVLEINYVYDLPIAGNAKGVTRTMLGGWQLSGITSLYSGLPLTIGSSADSAHCGCGGYRANLIGNANSGPKSVNEWFNTGAFAAPANNTFGDAARNIVYGAGIDNFDVSLFKNFAGIPFPANKEGATLQLRFEFFNFFNTTQFNSFSTTLQNGNFGQATGTRLPREIQLGAQFMF